MRASDFSPNYRSQISHLSGRSTQIHDLLVVGGGVNGCGIARDAVGRGLSVVLCEQDDLGGKTSSSSTKLFHGGLRYLEHYKFRLVHEALVEREVLLKAMPHISRPLRFVLPLHAGMRPAWSETVSDAGERIFNMIVASASGQKTKSEELDIGDAEFVPWQTYAQM